MLQFTSTFNWASGTMVLCSTLASYIFLVPINGTSIDVNSARISNLDVARSMFLAVFFGCAMILGAVRHGKNFILRNRKAASVNLIEVCDTCLFFTSNSANSIRRF